MSKESIASLMKQRDALRKKAKTAEEKRKLKQSIDAERRKLKKEIIALKNPRSTTAKKNFAVFTRKALKNTGSFIAKRAEIIERNIRIQAENEKRERMKSQKNIKRKIKAKKRN